MIFSYYLYKYPYKIIWHLIQKFGKNPDFVVYCAEPLDYVVLKPVIKHLPEIVFVVKNRKTAKFLKQRGINYKRMPCFPKAVMMSRHAAHKFPEGKILKIGFRHGAYHFKAFSKAKYYNAFDIYFVTSHQEVELTKKAGIMTTRAVGFPKLDPAFNGTYDETLLHKYRETANIDSDKKTIIFTATWDKSGMAAINKWINSIDTLTNQYNILVTVHPWTSKKYLKKLKSINKIYYIQDVDVLPYLMISDLLVGDTSSMIAEFCALDKPIITFKLAEAKRTLPEITQLLEDISFQVENFDQLKEAINLNLENPSIKSNQRQQVNEMMFDQLDGQAGKRAAKIITDFRYEIIPKNT